MFAPYFNTIYFLNFGLWLFCCSSSNCLSYFCREIVLRLNCYYCSRRLAFDSFGRGCGMCRRRRARGAGPCPWVAWRLCPCLGCCSCWFSSPISDFRQCARPWTGRTSDSFPTCTTSASLQSSESSDNSTSGPSRDSKWYSFPKSFSSRECQWHSYRSCRWKSCLRGQFDGLGSPSIIWRLQTSDPNSYLK